MKSTKVMWIALAIAALCGSFIAGYTTGSNTVGGTTIAGLVGSGGDYQKGIEAGLEKAKKILNESGFFPEESTPIPLKNKAQASAQSLSVKTRKLSL
jgi:hypothetical protein